MKFINKVKNTDVGILIRREYWRHRGKRDLKKYTDYEVVCKLYQERTGRTINLSNPQRYYEKLNWLKLFYRDEKIIQCSNKYTVRKYLTDRGYSHLLNELYAAYDSEKELDLNTLPDQFVIKASHGSGWNLIVKDKKNVNWRIWKKIMKSWLGQNASWFGREWNYETDSPKLVVEKYLEDETGQLRDYKVFCFAGKPEFVMVEEDRYTNHKRLFLDTEGKVLPVNDGFGFVAETTVQINDKWKEILDYAAQLSQPFPCVRVDFYTCNDKVYFGEFTFFNDAGYAGFEPDEWDYTWGKLIELPQPNHNLELLQKINNTK